MEPPGPTLPPTAGAGAEAVGGATGGLGGATGAGVGGIAGSSGGVSGTSGAGGVGPAAGGAAGAFSGAGGALAGSAGIGGALAGSAGTGGVLAGGGGTFGGSAGAGGAAAGAAGNGSGGSAGFTPAIDRTTAWNDPDYGCVNCHGDEGEGLMDRGPEIKHPNRELFDFMVRQGDAMPLPAYRDAMPPVTTAMISDPILDEIYTWLNSFPKPTTGAELYADYCSYCHGADGRGGLTQGYVNASHSAPYDETGAGFLQHVRDGHLREGASPVDASDRNTWMPPFPASVLTDQEVALIEAWLPKN